MERDPLETYKNQMDRLINRTRTSVEDTGLVRELNRVRGKLPTATSNKPYKPTSTYKTESKLPDLPGISEIKNKAMETVMSNRPMLPDDGPPLPGPLG